MKFLKRFVLIILLLVLVLIAVGYYVLPDSAHVERDVRVDAAPEAVFPYVNNFRKFNEWSPWSDWAPDIEYSFSGPDTGVGARMAWQSANPEVGTGSILITQSRPPERVTTRLDFGAQGDASMYFDVHPAGDGSRVVWGFDTEFGNNIIERYFGLLLELWVGDDFEQGLQSLKALVEQNQNE